MSDLVSLPKYWDMLRHFDWYYEMTDDHSVWSSARRRRDALRDIATKSEEHRQMYADFVKFAYSREDTPFERPERPSEETVGLEDIEE